MARPVKDQCFHRLRRSDGFADKWRSVVTFETVTPTIAFIVSLLVINEVCTTPSTPLPPYPVSPKLPPALLFGNAVN
jgi:hypothetical protein